jgi:hypothetical protein
MKITEQSMDLMFKRRPNVKFPETRNSSIESESSFKLDLENSKYSAKNNHILIRNSANITSPRLRVSSLNFRTSEILFPRENETAEGKREELIQSIKNKYLQKIEITGAAGVSGILGGIGLPNNRLPFKSPKGSLKTSTLSERTISPDPVNTPKLLNLIRDLKTKQNKPSK